MQMNILKLFLCTSWGKQSDRVLLARFQVVLKCRGVTKDAKDFQTCDNFYRTVITSFAIALCAHVTSCRKLSEFKKWLPENNWPTIISNVKQKYLGLSEVVVLVKHAKEQVASEALTAIKEQRAA